MSSSRKRNHQMCDPGASSDASETKKKLYNHSQAALSKTLDKYIASMKYSRFKEKYRKIYVNNPEEFKNIHNQLCTQLHLAIKEDLGSLYKNKAVDDLLISLEDRIKNCESNVKKDTWRPSGNAEEDLSYHTYPTTLAHKECLKHLLTKLSSENESLRSNITAADEENMNLKKDIDIAIDDFKKEAVNLDEADKILNEKTLCMENVLEIM